MADRKESKTKEPKIQLQYAKLMSWLQYISGVELEEFMALYDSFTEFAAEINKQLTELEKTKASLE